MEKTKLFRRTKLLLLMLLLCFMAIGQAVLALDNTSTVGSGTTNTTDAFYYSDQYMWKVSLFVAKADTVNRAESSINDFHRIGNEAVYLSPASSWSQWAGGSRPSHISSLLFSKENKIDTLNELNTKGGDVNALDPVTLTNINGVNRILGVPKLPYPPQMCDGMLFSNGVVDSRYVSSLADVTNYFNNSDTINGVLYYYANQQGKTPQQLVSEMEFTINGETRTGWNPEGILPKSINGNSTNQVEWLIVYEPCTIVYTRDTSKWQENNQWYKGFVLSATDFAVTQLSHQFDWRYDETRMSSWAGQQPDAWLPNSMRLHVARLSHLVVGNSVIIKDSWYGLEAGNGVDPNAAVPYNRWSSVNELKYGGWGMSMWEKPITYDDAINYDFNENTDIIYASNIYSNVNTAPGDELTVTYEINGESYTDTVIAPMKTQVLSYFKWHTPAVDSVTSYDLKITVSPYPKGTIGADGNEYVHKTITVRPLEEKTPPDPKVGDTLPTDFNKDVENNVPDSHVSDDTVKETDVPTIKSITEVSKAPYFYGEKVTLDIVTNRTTQSIDFRNTQTGDSRQLTGESVGNGILLSRFENKLDNTITWEMAFTMANFGPNIYGVTPASTEKGVGKEVLYALELSTDPDKPVIYDADILPKPEDRDFYYLYTDTKSPDLEYMIYYNTDGGTKIEPHKVKANTFLPVPEVPEKEGYIFSGWYKDNNFTELWDFDHTRIRGVSTLYAKWTIQTFNVSFNNSGKGNLVASQTVEYGQNIIEPERLVANGYIFEGWSTDSSLTTLFDFDNDVVKSDLTLFAKWTPEKYLVGFEENGGRLIEDQLLDYDALVTEPTTERPGYTFKGWFKDSALTSPWHFLFDHVTGNMVLYAKWEANPSNIVFEENGGTETADLNGVTDQEITDREMPVITRVGYTLKGWFEQADFSGDAVTELPVKFPVDGVTYYAKWEANPSNIVFKENGGTETADLNGVTDQEITDREMPVITRLGYTLKGWFEQADFSGDAVTELPAKFPVDGVTYYAKWEANPSVIVFEENGGTETADLNGVTDQKITAREMPVITRLGYTLKGWFEQDDFSGTAITELPAKYPVDGITYYAKWEANPSTITFISNGGSPVSDLVGVTDQEITDTTMPASTREHYTLDGWYINADLSGEVITALPAKYPVDGITYYAKWTPVKYTVSFDAMGGSAVLAQQIDYDTYATTPETPSRDGFVFKGWFKESACTNAWNFETEKITGDVTIFAKWEEGIPGPEVPLNDWSWEQINKIAELGLGESYFDIGEEKNITLSTGEVLTLQIYGFNHDTLMGGSGKTNITFGTKHLMDNLYQMNNCMVNSAYEAGCDYSRTTLRSYLNNGLTTQMPSSLQSIIKHVSKASVIFSSASQTVEYGNSGEFVFVFSSQEFNGESKYQIFKNGASVNKTYRNGESYPYWSRDFQGSWPEGYGKYTTMPWVAFSENSAGLQDWRGLCFGFAIGNAPTNTYTVAYNTNGGSAIANTTATLNTTISAPTVPIKSGYTLSSWYKDAGMTQKWDFANDKVTGNMTLYAKWGAQITFDSQGGTTVAPGKVEIGSLVVQPPSPSRDGYFFKGWFKESACLSAWNFATDRPTQNQTLYAKWEAGLPGPEVPLENWSWDQINRVAELGLAENYFVIGETKDIVMNGEILTLQIYGFNHDVLSDNTGNKTNITFGLRKPLNTTKAMSSTLYNYGGWNASPVRSWVNGEVYNQLSSDLRNIIKTVNKNTSGGADSPSIITSQDKLFLFSEVEITGKILGQSYYGEGEKYPIFTNDASRVKVRSTGFYPENSHWWSRSPIPSVDQYYVSIIPNGQTGATGASTNNFGIVFGFAIGNASTNSYKITYESNGGTAIAETSATLNTTITVPNAPTKINAIFDGWYKDSAFVSKWDFDNDKVTGSTTLYAKWSSLPTIGTPLADCTWDQVAAVADAGLGDVYWDIGDTKDMTLTTGEVVTMQIYDFDHDDLSSGSAKANITFGTKNLMADTRPMNSTSTNSGGWNLSSLRSWTNATLLDELPISIQNKIKAVTKATSGGYYSKSIVNSTDKVFLFSDVELFGKSNTFFYSVDGEGTQYQIFTDNASRIKKLNNGAGTESFYWLRSPATGLMSSNDMSFLAVATAPFSGDYGTGQASQNLAICFGFCMGTAKDMPNQGTALKDCSWQQIANVASAGKGDDYWNIGDTKDMVWSQTLVTMEIFDFNHDDKSDGTGKTNITFGTKNLVTSQMWMNTSNTNYYGWDGSTVRGWLEGISTTNSGTTYATGAGSLYSYIQNDTIKSNIISVKKQTSFGFNDMVVKPSNDKLFLFSDEEVFGTNHTYSQVGEGTLYPIFTDNASRLKYYPNGSVGYWWLRSPNIANDQMFYGVFNDGSPIYFGSSQTCGVAFGFCFGTAPKYTVTFDSQGGTAVTPKTAEINTTITVPYPPTKFDQTFAGWFKDATGTMEWNFTTDKVTGPTTLYAKWITLPAIGTSLEACSWDQIAYISKVGLADSFFDVGDTKNITLSTNEVLTMQIYGFDHDDKSDGSGKAGITFGTKDLMVARQTLSTNGDNSWSTSALRSWLNDTLTTQLPNQIPVKSVIKKTGVGNGAVSGIVTTSEKVFLFSEVEMFGSDIQSIAGEGSKYPIFSDGTRRIKKLNNGSGLIEVYCSRSPYLGWSNRITGVNLSGDIYNNWPSINWGITFGFCV
ncbi:InlB B-repeat-containing protein [Acetobacterium woodii]|nr:InlB B-repeat-containing protein [Acetobacterium woodii]